MTHQAPRWQRISPPSAVLKLYPPLMTSPELFMLLAEQANARSGALCRQESQKGSWARVKIQQGLELCTSLLQTPFNSTGMTSWAKLSVRWRVGSGLMLQHCKCFTR